MKILIASATLVALCFLASAQGLDVNAVAAEAKREMLAKMVMKTEAGYKSTSHERKKTTPESRMIAFRNALFQKSKTILMRKGLSDQEAADLAKVVVREDNGHSEICNEVDLEGCDENTRYRTIDGSCNNLQNPRWGAIATKLSRELKGVNFDYKSVPVFTESHAPFRKGASEPSRVTGENEFGHCGVSEPESLPSARLVSTVFHDDVDQPDHKLTHMVTQLGQFLDHDITLTPEYEEEHCCMEPENPECFPIPVGQDDSFFGSLGTSCLELRRSVPFCEENGGPPEQFNALSAFLDSSNVYSSNDTMASLLRAENDDDGKMNVTIVGDGVELLPRDDKDQEIAGDTRARDMPGLAAMHTVFIREHNRLADLVRMLKPSWDGEKIYQEVRRIVIAEWQNIIYSEYLPAILGDEHFSEDLSIQVKNGVVQFSQHSPKVDPSITNEFATAAFRFGHSMIQGFIQMWQTSGIGSRPVKTYELHNHYFNMERYREEDGEGMEQILMGLVTQKAQKVDQHATGEISNKLFPDAVTHIGSDLIARNIQRGRDHGLPPFACYYTKIVDDKYDCSLGWDVRPEGISDKKWERLSTVYLSPCDIDLFTGGLAQKPHRGAITGQIFSHMIAKQFQNLKSGDRHFFTHENEFSKDALKILTSRKFSDIICDNTSLGKIQKMALFAPDKISNPRETCSATSSLDIKALEVLLSH